MSVDGRDRYPRLLPPHVARFCCFDTQRNESHDREGKNGSYRVAALTAIGSTSIFGNGPLESGTGISNEYHSINKLS